MTGVGKEGRPELAPMFAFCRQRTSLRGGGRLLCVARSVRGHVLRLPPEVVVRVGVLCGVGDDRCVGDRWFGFVLRIQDLWLRRVELATG